MLLWKQNTLFRHSSLVSGYLSSGFSLFRFQHFKEHPPEIDVLFHALHVPLQHRATAIIMNVSDVILNEWLIRHLPSRSVLICQRAPSPAQ
jgi:hypothetical protein